MCLTLRPAKLTDTVLYAAETMHAGRLVHVMGYQNKAANRSPGPNAMLLPIPSDAMMGPDNMLDTTSSKHILKDYSDAVRAHHTRLSRGFSKNFLGALPDDRVQVFDKGSYTVAMADDAKSLTAALGRIPDNKRPAVNAEIFAAYDRLYPGWKMALCAWDGTIEAEPLLWWYEPKNAGLLFLPALDAHDGNPPKLASQVDLDHTVVVGSVMGSVPEAFEVHFREEIPEHLRPFVATKILGQEWTKRVKLKNGDFSVRVSNMRAINRIDPPGAAALG
jgi:hypothetical protein